MLCLFAMLLTSVNANLIPLVPAAKATINPSEAQGAAGHVVVYGGKIQIELDLSNFSFSATRVTAEQCRAGINYHIHFDIPQTTLVGDACGVAGGHYDPWFACGGATGSSECVNKGGCIDRGRPYNCNSQTFVDDPLTMCEVGDWSGKYGKLMPSSSNGNDVYSIEIDDASRFEMSASQLYRTSKSIVFHCGSPRILCAKFYPDPMMVKPDVAAEKGLYKVKSRNEHVVADFQSIRGPLIEFGGGQMRIGGWRGRYGMKMITDACQEMDGVPQFLIVNESMSESVGKNDDCPSFGTPASIVDPTVSCVPGSESSFCESQLGVNGLKESTRCGAGSSSFVYGSQDFGSDPYLIGQGASLMPYQNKMFGRLITYRLLDTSLRALSGNTLLIFCKNPTSGPRWCAKMKQCDRQRRSRKRSRTWDSKNNRR